jgi:hypothetical protein
MHVHGTEPGWCTHNIDRHMKMKVIDSCVSLLKLLERQSISVCTAPTDIIAVAPASVAPAACLAPSLPCHSTSPSCSSCCLV